MSLQLTALTPTVGAAPGETVTGRIEVHNDGSTDAVCSVAVVGLTPDDLDESAPAPAVKISVPAGSTIVSEISIAVPRALGIGQHAAAFEATSDRPGDRAVLTPFTVSIVSVARVELVPQPSTIRARRRADFHLDVINNEPQQVDISIVGEAPDVQVSFTPSVFSLRPGQRAVSKGHVKGPRRIAGENLQHNILVTARGRASTTSTTAPYIQRPLFAHRMRMGLALLSVVALWLAAIGGVALWLSNRDNGASDATAELIGVDTDGDGIIDAFFLADGTPVTGTDSNGDGIPDVFVDADGNVIIGLDTDGDGIPDAIVDGQGNKIVAVDTNGDGIADALSDGSPLASADDSVVAGPSTTVLRGTVNADGDPTAVAITLVPIELGATDAAAPIGFRGAATEPPSGKIWSARTATLADLAPTVRRSVAIDPVQIQPNGDGVWLFTDVAQGQSYEVAFVRPGYDTQSFVITPPVGGEPIELDVEMVPSKGALSGTVVGPSGGLGGAEVIVTDGTLTFTTTSDSNGGGWALDAISTPGIYTVSASLRGYATAVRQVELTAGQKSTNVNLQMVPGLATMTGLVTDANGVGLGGATVTASNGETTLTTSTLTDGNVGFFSLPQLASPATYTVSTTLDGYITQTRRVPLQGSLSGIDFTMTSTTLVLSGQVLSSNGGPIESAGLTISTGDLRFRATTSQSGVFSVDRLPPGNYTVTVEHYQHEPSTVFVALTAGQQPAPLTVTLVATDGPPDVGTGSLAVSVINSDPTITPRGITGATVTVSRNGSSDAPRVITDPKSPNVVFDNLPIGTYTIRVTAPGFNASPPDTKSVGFTLQQTTIALQKLGTANGTVIDSLTKAPLKGYTVTLFRISGGSSVPVGTFNEKDGKWQSGEDLPTGTYRAVINAGDEPAGYVVRDDQTFVIPEVKDEAVEAIVVPPIEADAYPNIDGRIYKPLLVGNTITYGPIDADTLVVKATCGGQDVKVTTSSFGGDAAKDDAFSIAFTAIAEKVPAAQLPTTCTIAVSAPGSAYVADTMTLTNIVANNGATSTDRRAGMALSKPAPAVNGTVFWNDLATTPPRVPLPNVAISSIAEVITRFLPTDVVSTSANPEPTYVTAPVITSSTPTPTAADPTPAGLWTVNQQIFGNAIYRFETPNFGPAQLPISVNESGTAAIGPDPATGVVVTGSFDVEMRPPGTGDISGKVTIETTRAAPRYADAIVTGAAPGGGTTTLVPNASGDFLFDDVNAGTWSIAFATPPNHAAITPTGPVATLPASSVFLTPGGVITGVNAKFVELGTVDVKFFEPAAGTPTTAITPATTLTLTDLAGNPVRNLAGDVISQAFPAGTTSYSLSGIPVAATSPQLNAVDYKLVLTVDGYDTAGAVINKGGIVQDRSTYPVTLPVSIKAGQVAAYSIEIQPFGSITGSIVGQPASGPGTVALSNPPTTLDFVRVDRFGTTITPPPGEPVKVPVLAADASFTITGPPGFYKLTPAHPVYQATPAFTPPDTLDPTLPAGVFEMRNGPTTNALAPYRLSLRTGVVQLSAVADLTGQAPVTDAVYSVSAWVPGTPCTGAAGDTAVGVTGTTTISGLVPGTYCLAVNRFAGVDRVAFPAIVKVEIPNQTAGSPPVVVVAPLPSLYPSITGILVAKNSASPTPGVVPLQATAPLELQSSFTSANNVLVDGTLVGNVNTGASKGLAVPKPLPAVPQPSDYEWVYEFKNLPIGNHDITAPSIAGYTLSSATQNVTLPGFGPTSGPTFTYTVSSSPVEIDLGSGAFPSLDSNFPDTPKAAVTLTLNDGTGTTSYTNYQLLTNIAGRPNVLVVQNVQPDVRGFTLTFDDALHASVSANVTIPLAINAQGRRTATPITVTADRVRLTGTALQRTGPSTVIELGTNARLSLTNKAGAPAVDYLIAPGDADTAGLGLFGQNYVIDAVPGTYAFALTNTVDGYEPTSIDPLSLPTAGIVVTRNMEIVRRAVVTVNVNTGGLTAPAGLQLRLLDAANTVIAPRAGTTNVFDVVGGTYRARGQATNYPDQVSGANVIDVGRQDAVIALTLPRVLRVNVSGAADMLIEVINTSAPNTVRATASGGPGLYEFFSNAATQAIPASGNLSVRLSKDGFRTQVLDVGNVILNSPTPAIALPPNVTATGTITGASAGDPISATDGVATRSGTISLPAGETIPTYSIPNLGVGTWTINYAKIGAGTVATSIGTVTSTSANTITTPLTVSPRNAVYDFIVQDSTSTKVSGARVEIFNAGGSLGFDTSVSSDGGASVSVFENTAPTKWVISKAGYLTRSGPIGQVTSLSNNIGTQRLIAEIVGQVTDAGAGVVGATVTVCPSASTEPCTSVTGQVAATTTVAVTPAADTGRFTFNDEIPAGTYKVWAQNGTKVGSVTPDGRGAHGDAVGRRHPDRHSLTPIHLEGLPSLCAEAIPPGVRGDQNPETLRVRRGSGSG